MNRTIDDRGRARIEEVARAHLDHGWHRGAQLAIYRDGALQLDLALGTAEGKRMLWFSATKPITATAILQLVERGALSLDTRIAEVWPEFAAGDKGACTVRHVLTHQGGFPVLPPDADWSSFDDWDYVAGIVASTPARWEPGTAIGYHAVTYGFALGEVIRRVDGREPREYLRDEIFQPLGMDASLGLGPDGDLGGVALPEAISEVTMQDPEGVEARTSDIVRRFRLPAVLRGQLPAANGIGTAEALARFYAMLVAGGEWKGTRILQPETIAEATRVQAETVADEINGLPASFGLGFSIGGIFSPFDQPGVFGHGGQQCAISWGDPFRGTAVAYVTTGLHDPYVVQTRTEELFQAVAEACDRSN